MSCRGVLVLRDDVEQAKKNAHLRLSEIGATCFDTLCLKR
jgi:hypothetical protein